jgi:hypothetical protein
MFGVKTLKFGINRPLAKSEKYLFKWKKFIKSKTQKHFSFLPFFKNKKFGNYYKTFYENFYTFSAFLSYGFSKNKNIKNALLFTEEILAYPSTFKKDIIKMAAVSKTIKKLLSKIDEKFYNKKLPNWFLHKSSDSFQIINTTDFPLYSAKFEKRKFEVLENMSKYDEYIIKAQKVRMERKKLREKEKQKEISLFYVNAEVIYLENLMFFFFIIPTCILI